MAMAKTHAERTPHDLSHLCFSVGEIGRLQTLSVTPVIGGDSFEQSLNGSLKLSPLRRGLSVDSVVDVMSFYIPHRHIYGDEWNEFMLQGAMSTPIPSLPIAAPVGTHLNHIALNHRFAFVGDTAPVVVPKWRIDGYTNIYNNYFKFPDDEDRQYWADTGYVLTEEEGHYGYRCTHKKSIWTHKIPVQGGMRDITFDTSGDESSINLQALNMRYGELHTEEERELFGQRFRDVVSNLGGKTPYDADNRPRLLGRTEQWLSGYDVDGTDEVSLGQHTGRINAELNHSIARFAVPEHGAVWTVAVVRFPPIHAREIDYLSTVGVTTYDDIIGDPAIVANQPRKILQKRDLFTGEPNEVREFGEVPHSQWYRHQANVVHRDYSALQGFPFLEDSVGDERFEYVTPSHYDEVFQTSQLAHWNLQARNNIIVQRALPTARDVLLTNV